MIYFDLFIFDYLAENIDEDLNRLLTEERQRCDALAADSESMFHLLEETRSQNLQNENHFKEEILNQQKQIDQLNEDKNHLQQFKDEQLSKQPDVNKNRLFSFIYFFQEEENRFKEFQVREMLERQLIELNEDLQALENDKNEMNQQIRELKEQLKSKDRQIQTFEVSKQIP
jgi:NDP-sugar pyrophosphorylase family protein